MAWPNEIEFCKKRIGEQHDYINTTFTREDISKERKSQLLTSAFGVLNRFVKRLAELQAPPNE